MNHEIPFNDEAGRTRRAFGEIMFADGYVLGGADQTPAIHFGDAPGPMFKDLPGCWLHRQASFITAQLRRPGGGGGRRLRLVPPPAHRPGGDLYAGELTVVGSNANRPEVADFLERSPPEEVQCAHGWRPGVLPISPNVNVGPECYVNDILADASVVLTEALANDTGRFDASDLMPSRGRLRNVLDRDDGLRRGSTVPIPPVRPR